MSRLVLVFAALALVGSAVGCKPEIGDSCSSSTDCSVTGDRLCDTSMPDGYCTIYNCDPGGCPSESVCVEFHPKADRFARRFCVRGCNKASDCRGGYACVDPKDRDGRIDEGSPDFSTICLP
jgi:hypothetical protein